MKTTAALLRLGKSARVLAGSIVALLGAVAAHAATIDTTGGVTITAPTNIGANDATTDIINAGTLTFDGTGTIGLGNNGFGHVVNMNMTGGLIDVLTGVNLQNGGWQSGVWTNNLASIAVAGGATLDLWDGNPVRVDALTGAGTVTISPTLGVNWAGGRSFVLGVNGGSGTFTGNISGNSASDGGSLSLTKEGAGTQTLSGNATYNGTTTVNGGTLKFMDNAPNLSGAFFIASGASLEFNVSTSPNAGDGVNIALGKSGGTTITGTGTFVKSGNGVLGLDGQGGNHAVTFNMDGGVIDIQGGTLKNGGWDGGYWTNNKASMNIASGARFDIWGGQSVIVDALTGAGTIESGGYGHNQTLTVGINNGSGTFSGVYQNGSTSLGLIKTGTGTQTLSGANTYTGATTVSAGTLNLGHNQAVQNSTVNVAGGVLTFATGVTSPTLGGLRGSGNVTLATASSQPVTLAVGSNGQSTAYSGILSGAGGLTKQGGGTLTVAAVQSYTGATVINAGTLRLGAATSYPTEGLMGRWTFDAGNAADTSGNGYGGTAVGSPTYSGADTHGGSGNALVLNGSSAIKVDTGGNQTVFNGGTAMTISAWVEGWPDSEWNPFISKNGEPNGWQMRRSGSVNQLDWTTRGAGGDFRSTTTIVANGAWHMVTMTYDGATKIIYVDGVQDSSTAASGTIEASTSLLMFGARDNGGIGNYFTGKLDDIYFYNRSITSAEVAGLYSETVTGSNGLLPSTTPVTIASGAAFDLNGNAQQIASLTGTSGASVTNGGGADSILTISGTASTTFAGVISDGATKTISLVKTGTGTQTLSGANTYTGTTTVNGGKLFINGSISGSTTVNSGGTLGGSGTTGAVTVASGGTLAPGNSTGILTVGSFTQNSGAHLAMQIGGTVAGFNTNGSDGYDRLIVNSTLTIAGDLDGTLINGYLPTGATYNTGTNQLNLDGATFYLVIGASSLSGTFANQQAPNALLTGFNTITFGGQQFAISYAANYNGGVNSSFSSGGHDIALMAIPEPQTWAMVLGGFGMLIGIQRMRRKTFR